MSDREREARIRERLAEAEDFLRNIGGHVNDAIAGRITTEHAIGEIGAELDDYDAHRALNDGGEDG